MSDEQFAKRLHRIIEIARAQKEGAYTPQSDAMQALELIETLALLLIEKADWKIARRDKEIKRLEESLHRMDKVDPDEIESSEYERVLSRLVALRNEAL